MAGAELGLGVARLEDPCRHFRSPSPDRRRTGAVAFKADVDLTIRGTTRPIPLDVTYLGEWKTPFWEGDENKGEMRRIGLEATARIDRHDFGVSWQDEIPGGGVVVSNDIDLILDVEAMLLDDLERTGAIEYYLKSRS